MLVKVIANPVVGGLLLYKKYCQLLYWWAYTFLFVIQFLFVKYEVGEVFDCNLVDGFHGLLISGWGIFISSRI